MRIKLKMLGLKVMRVIISLVVVAWFVSNFYSIKNSDDIMLLKIIKGVFILGFMGTILLISCIMAMQDIKDQLKDLKSKATMKGNEK